MSLSLRSRALIAGAAIILGTTSIAACSSDDSGASSSGKVSIVASTDVWGSVARAVAGDKADVSALYSSPEGDPHEFEATARDTAEVQDAGLVVMNGADYDPYMEKAPKGSGSTVIDAFDEYKKLDPGASTRAGAVNEHFFYNFAVVARVADAIASALGRKDSANAQTYTDNAKAFTDKLSALSSRLTQIKTAHSGVEVAQTEPLAAYLLTDAGLVDATPDSFKDAVEAGQDPPASAIATTQDLIRDKKVKALLYNTQAVDEITKQLLSTADGNGLPVVKITETLPAGVTDYIAWQTANVDAIAAAVG